MPRSLSCPTCNGALPSGRPGQTVQCQFCGNQSILPGGPGHASHDHAPQAPPPTFDPPPSAPPQFTPPPSAGPSVTFGGPDLGGPGLQVASSSGRGTGCIVTVVALVLLAAGGLAIRGFISSVTELADGPVVTVPQPGGGAAAPAAPAVEGGPIQVVDAGGAMEDVREIGVAGDGVLVAAEFGTGLVRRIGADGQVISEFDAVDDGVVQEMAVSRDGRVHIVRGFDVRAFSATGERLPDVTYPTDEVITVRDGVAPLPDGGLLVVERGATLVRLDAAGAVASRVTPAFLGDGPGFQRVAVDSGGLLFGVATRFVDGGIEDGLHLVDADRMLLRTLAPDGGLSGLSDVAVDSRSRVAVTTLVGGVRILNAQGEDIATIPVSPAFGVAFADDGTLWVAAGDRVERWEVPEGGQ